MDEEMDSIEKNETWQLVNILEGKECIGVKWVYKSKFNAKGEFENIKKD